MKIKPGHPRWNEWRELTCQFLEADLDWETAQNLALAQLDIQDNDDEQYDSYHEDRGR